jgi:hypothetical protein
LLIDNAIEHAVQERRVALQVGAFVSIHGKLGQVDVVVYEVDQPLDLVELRLSTIGA